MKQAGLPGVALVSLALCLGCSRPKDQAVPPPSTTSALPVATTPATTSAAQPPAPGRTALPTPEDVEEDSAHRITEQNLESELDRLEREIQAE